MAMTVASDPLGVWVTGALTHNRLWFQRRQNHNRLYAGRPVTQTPSVKVDSEAADVVQDGLSCPLLGAGLALEGAPIGSIRSIGRSACVPAQT